MAQDTSSTKINKGLDDYVLLGRSGLRVSPLCLGTTTFGEQWGIGSNKEEAKKVFDLYYEKGGNFFDTANVYNFGESERFLGDYVSDKRSDVVVATKYTINTTAMQTDKRLNPNFGGNHRKSLVENLNKSLKRLNMMEKFYILLQAMFHPGYSLVPIQLQNYMDGALSSDFKRVIGIVAEGFLTGKYTRKSTTNLKSNYRDRSISCSGVTNWIQQKPGITSPIIGARTVTQLEENLESLEFKLTPEQMKRLDDVSKPTGREIPFPYSLIDKLDKHLGKNIEVPDKFGPIATTYNYGRLY
ncbi:aldo/keto reductase [Rhizophagus clarus]|uniref:Aldo/keto reductase n=1 Tax=Rhizophagus clarus TaxID=94130 RepID=A0A8H3KWT8_9GLOM|nr:aldo/keto reductase [Rhizophagus clarus]